MKRKTASSQPTKIAESNDEEKEELYEVEKILADAFHEGELLYQTKWVGYDEMTWEPRESFKGCLQVLTDYEKTKVKPKKRARSSRSKSGTKTPTRTTKDEEKDSRARSSMKRKAATSKETSRESLPKPKAGSRARSTTKVETAVEQGVQSRESTEFPVPKRREIVQDDRLEPAIRYFSSKSNEATSDDEHLKNFTKGQEDFTIDWINSENSEQLKNHYNLQCYATLMHFKRLI